MFLISPIILIVVSILGILVIVLRKKSYLNKLHTLDTAGNGNEVDVFSSIFSWKKYGHEFFPELKILIDRLEVHKYKGRSLMEVEKILRRTRVMFLKIDRWSDSTIKRVRRIHVNSVLNGSSRETSLVQPVEGAGTEETTVLVSPTKEVSMSHVFLKNEEERLIIEIAKNPKNAKLYEDLGNIYMEMESFVDAKESYEAAIELNPQDESLKQKLSSALEKTSSH